MKILIDGHMLGKHEGGNERYIKNLAFNLIKYSPKKYLVKIAVQEDYFINQNVFPRNNLLGINYNNDFYRVFYFLPTKLNIGKYDIIHSTYIAPYFYCSKTVITVHDLSFKRYPDFYSLREKVVFNYLLPASLLKAKAIIVPSQFTKNEFVKFFPKYKNKVFVVYEGADKCFSNINKNIAKKEIREKYRINSPFLLVFNSKNPKKNINVVIKAFKKISRWWSKLKLVIIGGKDNLTIRNLDNVYFLNNIPDRDLNFFYNGCEIFLSPSIYEGFNLPIIEALKTKAIVMASNIEVNKELYDDAIVYFNPYNDAQIEQIVKKILKTPEIIRKKIMNQYKKIADKFDWGKNTQKMLEIYQRINQK